MIYIFENDNNNASWTIEGHLLTEEQKANAIIIEQLPEKQNIEGKVAVLKCKKETGEVWYEYEDIPITEDEKIAELEKALLEATTLIAIQEQKALENEQAILELTTLIGGMM